MHQTITDDEIDDMFAKVDTDNSGEIDYSEFVIATMGQKQMLHDSKI
jgi:Ca2+-binding EF-hand superfamily protein